MRTQKVACPSCDARLQFTGDLSACRRVRCPKCATVFRAPGEESEEEVTHKDAPEPRKPRKKPQKSALPLVLGLVAGLTLLLIGGGVTLAVFLLPPKNKAELSSPIVTPTPAPGPTDTDTGPHAAGKRVFAANNCARCHSTAGAGGGKGRGRGPDLSRVGANHTANWLSEHVLNPKAHRPNSRMPAYEGKIQPDDLRSLSEYLASLK